MKNIAGDIIILHMHTKNHNHVMYGFWDMECDRQNFLSLWTIFWSFTPLWTQKIKILQKWKKHLNILSFLQMFTISHCHMIFGFSDRECNRQNFFVILNRFLPFHPSNNLKNQNFEKLKKAPGDIIILHKCTKNHDHMLYCSLEMARNGFNCYFWFWAIFYPFTSLTAQKIKI